VIKGVGRRRYKRQTGIGGRVHCLFVSNMTNNDHAVRTEKWKETLEGENIVY
jgi:hypothetical protein